MVSDDYLARHRRHEDAGLSDLRREALQRVLWGILIFALLLFLVTGVYIAQVDVTPAYVALALVALVGGATWALRLGITIAAGVLVVGLVLVIAGAVALLPAAPALAALCLPVLIATALLGTVAGGATLVVGGGLIAAVALNATPSPLSTTLILTFGLAALIFVFCVLLWRSFYTVLDWAWQGYVQAQAHARELRERQVELGRLNQSLILAYEQIKQTSARLERARQAAEEARRLKAEFAASVSHELRTPLNLIIGLSELMVVAPHPGTPALPEAYHADVEAIYRNACHISNLIDDVLDLSQIEAHHMGLLREEASLPEIVAQAAATVRTLFETTGLSLRVCLPPDLPPLFVDPVRVRQILINLLNNAVRFTEEGGVTISARCESHQIVIDVADTGTGIAPLDLPAVFHEFWRSGEPIRGRRGSGLGLAVSKRFAELHGGNMWVSSTLGQGTTFSLALPLGEKSVVQDLGMATEVWRRMEQQSPECPVVLLVDPQPETLRVFQRYLDGYRVVTVPKPERVTPEIEKLSPRAILVESPAQRDAVRRALQQATVTPGGLRLPVITCKLRTAKRIAQELGVREYLVKPVSQQQMRRVVKGFGAACRDLVLIDDDPEMLHLLARMVGALAPRCRLRTASDGARAIQLLDTQPPDGILLDLLMPGLDGYGVLAWLKQEPRLARTPVVVITARGAEDDGLVVEALEIDQDGGLNVEELSRWVRAGLTDRPPGPGWGFGRGDPTTLPGSPAYAESR
jgi:signal transduction histidine kinase/CheY-like chemotaxis protein